MNGITTQSSDASRSIDYVREKGKAVKRLKNIMIVAIALTLLLLSRMQSGSLGSHTNRTFYVDASNTNDPLENGSFEHPFDKIQEGIDAAYEWYNVFVRVGTYFEKILLNKTISLIGEDRNTTIIDGSRNGLDSSIISLNATGATITGFKIQKAYYGGIAIKSDKNTIINNIISDIGETGICAYIGFGIELVEACKNLIVSNEISRSSGGIKLYYSDENTISGNIVTDTFPHGLNALSHYGIGLFDSCSNNMIIDNTISHIGLKGVYLFEKSNNNSIIENTISDCGDGISLADSGGNIIYHNNLIGNEFSVATYFDWFNTSWDNGYPSGGNYWSDYTGIDDKNGPDQSRSGSDWVGDTSYVIKQSDLERGRDRYPLMQPFVPEMEKIYVAHRELLLKYAEVQSDFEDLNSILNKLGINVTNLQDRYDSFGETIRDIEELIDSLGAAYDNLQGQISSLSNQLNKTLGAMYILTATTVVLIATAVCLAARKPKMKTRANQSEQTST